MTARIYAMLLSLLCVAIIVPTVAFANDGGDRVQFFQSINVGPDEHVGDVVCLFCSIKMSGSCGDAVAVFGSVIMDGSTTGDVVSVGGGIKLGEDANVGGNAVAIGQGLYRHPEAVVKGQTVSQAGPIIFLGLIIIPLLPFLLVIAFVVWLVRRNQYAPRAQVAYRR